MPSSGSKSTVFLSGVVVGVLVIYTYLGFVAHTNPDHHAHPTLPPHAVGRQAMHPTLPLIHHGVATNAPAIAVEVRPPAPLSTIALPSPPVVAAIPPSQPPPLTPRAVAALPPRKQEAAAAAAATKVHPVAARRTVGSSRPPPPETAAPAVSSKHATGSLQSQPGPGVGQWQDGKAEQSHGSQPKVAIVVPIRDAANALSQGVGRWKNADELVQHMCTFLPKANAPLFDVVFIEQSDDGNPFNKGVLFNAGYKLTVNDGYSHMVLHDVDQIPENTKNSYGHPGKTAIHLLTATSQWNYTPMHKDTVGGALSLTHQVYSAVGGYSNLFWGWGGEDNNMYTRLNAGPGVRRPPVSVGRYKALFHPRVMGLDETEQFKNNHKIIHKLSSHDAQGDGIANVKYKTRQTRHRAACGGSSSNNGNSVVIQTIDVLNTENLHPDAAGPGTTHAPASAALVPPSGAVAEGVAASVEAGDSAEAVFEIVLGHDCEGHDIRKVACKEGQTKDECIAAIHVECVDTPACIGFNYPGGWLKSECPMFMRFPDSTLYIHQNLVAERKAALLNFDDHTVAMFDRLAALKSAQPVVLHAACPVRVFPDRITVSRGGEEIASVYGRAEEDEYPRYAKSTFVSECSLTDHSSRARKKVGHFASLKEAFEEGSPRSAECVSPLEGNGGPPAALPGVFMQRYEYANLYHTMCDWAALFDTMEAYNLKRDEFQLVWLDGHAAGALDEAWKLLFTKHVAFVKHSGADGCSNGEQCSKCYNPAFFPADGSKSDLYEGCTRSPARSARFAKYAVEQLGLLNTKVTRTILVIDRRPYLAHPRLQTPLPHVASRSWDNVQEIIDAVHLAFPEDDVKLVSLPDYTFLEQVALLRSARAVVGMHGAAMSYMIFMSPDTHLIEISVKSPKMFKQFAKCAPWVHHTFLELALGSPKDHSKSKAYHIPPDKIVSALRQWGPPSL